MDVPMKCSAALSRSVERKKSPFSAHDTILTFIDAQMGSSRDAAAALAVSVIGRTVMARWFNGGMVGMVDAMSGECPSC